MNPIMLQRVLFTVVFAFSMTAALAQLGSISGTITDAKTGEAIIGANVIIEGTSVGAASDIDGNYSIENVKPGTYKLNVSFITYKTHVINDVVVESGKKTTVKVAMVEDATELQEIVVSGTREINTDFALIGAIKESKLVVSGISAEQISKSQDRDAAQVVRRVPGITIQDNRFVVVRGLSSRYSSIMLNGVIAPSTEADSRAFSFDVIPSGLLDRMLVAKSGSADLPGDFAGAVVQINTKNAVEENFTNVSLGTGVRRNTTFTDRMTQQRSSTDWLAFDDGMRRLPSSAPANYENLQNPSVVETESRKFKNTWSLQQINVRPDLRFSFDMGRNFDLGKINVSTINAVNYSNTFQHNAIEFNRFEQYDPQTGVPGLTVFLFDDEQLTNNVRLGLLSNWTFKYSDNSKIEFRNLYNRLGTTQTTVREGARFLSTDDVRNYSSRYIERSIYSGQVEGTHNLKNEKSTLNWVAGYTSAKRNEPDWKRLTTVRAWNAPEGSRYVIALNTNATAVNAARFYQELDEYSVTHRLNFEHNFNKVNEDGDAYSFKTGYWLEYKDRSFQARQIAHVISSGFEETGPIGSLPYDRIFAPENVSTSNGHFISEGTNITDSYFASNTLGAGYISFTLPFTARLSVVPGIRLEHNIQELRTPRGPNGADVSNPITSVLPSVNMTYDISSATLLRVAYSKTVNRPEFRELAPFSFYDFDNAADVRGNPDLEIADIHNLDARWEYYPTPSEFVSAGVFYKRFNNPIEARIENGANNPTFPFENADKAQNYGVEVEVRKALAYTSGSKFLNNTSVVLNAAYIVSQIKLENDGTLQEKDTRPMQGQSPYIVNAGLFYNDEVKGFQANVQYNVFGKRIAFVGLPGAPTWWELPQHLLDFSVSKRIMAKGELRLGINDILNTRQFFREDGNLDNDLGDLNANRLVRGTRNGQYFTLGFAWKF